jgi:hypothetical protein
VAKETKPIEPGAGNVPIMLGGKEHVMVPTLEACMALSKWAGGAGPLIRRLIGQDFDAICEVISIGCGFTSMTERKLIAEAVYQTGTIGVAADCILFVRVVNNGGRIPDDDNEGGEGDPDVPLSQPELSTAE